MFFSTLKGRTQTVRNETGGSSYILSEELLRSILREVTSHVDFDEKWYCQFYPDIGRAVAANAIPSGRHHYVEKGYFENRMPKAYRVDERFYLAEYPDARLAIQLQKYASAQDHFDKHGHKEGRLPFKDFTVFKPLPKTASTLQLVSHLR